LLDYGAMLMLVLPEKNFFFPFIFMYINCIVMEELFGPNLLIENHLKSR